MGRKRKGLPISGWINLDKPAGLTSSACVNAVRRATGAAKRVGAHRRGSPAPTSLARDARAPASPCSLCVHPPPTVSDKTFSSASAREIRGVARCFLV